MSEAAKSVESWEECFQNEKHSAWLREILEKEMRYSKPLPIQAVMVPEILQTVKSEYLPMDVSLTAPTGSGKTLCYLLPMLVMIAMHKRGIDTNELRALVLVPTRALGQQVYAEVQRLIKHTTITAVTLCNEQHTVKSEAEALVRAVRAGVGSTGATFDGDEDDDDEGDGSFDSSSNIHYFSKADIVITTPQRLLTHLDGTAGLRLSSLKLLVVDEADQILTGSFANFVAKVLQRHEEEVDAILRRERKLYSQGSTASPTTTGLRTLTNNNESDYNRKRNRFIVQKVLCSATLSSRVALTSDVQLRNCRAFTLTSHGDTIEGGSNDLDPNRRLDTAKQASVVKSKFALPPTLQEHVVFCEDSYRPAVLLKLVHTLTVKIEKFIESRKRAIKQKVLESRKVDLDQSGSDSDGEKEDTEGSNVPAAKPKKPVNEDDEYPTLHDCSEAGTTIVVFCDSAEEARVTGHYLLAADLSENVLEFTTLTSLEERRRALLGRNSASKVTILVCSDAMMRGLDIPNVGHVVLYKPPVSLASFVHRAGRTARAMRSGHLHVLLSKHEDANGVSEVSQYQSLTAAVHRSLPVKYERHFFRFEVNPNDAKKAARIEKQRRIEEANSKKKKKKEDDKNKKKKEDEKEKKSAAEDETKLEEEHVEEDKASTNDKNSYSENEGEEAEGNAAEDLETTLPMDDNEDQQPEEEQPAELKHGSAEWWVEQSRQLMSEGASKLERDWSSALESARKKKKEEEQKQKEKETNDEKVKANPAKALPQNQTHSSQTQRQDRGEKKNSPGKKSGAQPHSRKRNRR